VTRRRLSDPDEYAVGCALLVGMALCAGALSLGWLLEHWRR
jgi:hypothetical protein